jgi:hypothetical protein
MAYSTNPFLERMSERTTSDLEFVSLFSPKILEKLPDTVFEPGVHVFRSAPGGGKTTLLRAFTPQALRAFWNSRRSPDLAESFQKLLQRGVLTDQESPQFLGVVLSCASGYADIPPGVAIRDDGLFRALIDCRIVLRTLRSLTSLLGLNWADDLSGVEIRYPHLSSRLKYIPAMTSARELANWAEQREQQVFSQLDSFVEQSSDELPVHYQFEGPAWLQQAEFLLNGRPVARLRLLMLDDVQTLRKKQRALLFDELTIQRNMIPIWLAERSIVLGEKLLSQGARLERDIFEHSLEELWGGAKSSQQFMSFALSILDRRMVMQDVVASHSFTQCLRSALTDDDVRAEIAAGAQKFLQDVERHSANIRYSEWLGRARAQIPGASLDSLTELYVTRILMVRDESKRQLSLDLALSIEDLDERDNSQVRGAAEIFINNEYKVPYYFGIERMCTMASNNVEELLSLAAEIYAGIRNKQLLRPNDVALSPSEQEKLLKQVARRKRDFIPRSHTEGLRAQRLIDAIGSYCKEKTFSPNAPYAPGVTGFRLSFSELNKLVGNSRLMTAQAKLLLKVLSECCAENLIFAKPSAASTSREGGTVFYLNRTLCAHYGLPLQLGGWQDVSVLTLMSWMELGSGPTRRSLLDEIK